MKSSNFNQSSKEAQGFAHFAVLMLIIVVAVVAFSGWAVYSTRNKTTPKPTSLTNTQGNGQTPFTKSSDIDESEKVLNNASVDSDMETSGIDSDLKAVL